MKYVVTRGTAPSYLVFLVYYVLTYIKENMLFILTAVMGVQVMLLVTPGCSSSSIHHKTISHMKLKGQRSILYYLDNLLLETLPGYVIVAVCMYVIYSSMPETNL